MMVVAAVGGGSGVLATSEGTVTDTTGTGINGDVVAAQEENETTTVGENETTTTVFGQVTTTAVAEIATGTPRVRFENQTSNGSTVVVQRALLPDDGFIAIHLAQNVSGNYTENVTAEMRGERIGNSTYLEAGEHDTVTIRLDRPINESQVLIASLYRDTNENQQFDPVATQTTMTTVQEGTRTSAAEQVDTPFTIGNRSVMDTAFVRIGGTTTTNATTTEA